MGVPVRTRRAFVAAILAIGLAASAGGSAEAGRRGKRAHEKQVQSRALSGALPDGTGRRARYHRFRARDAFTEPAVLMILTSPGSIVAGSTLKLTVRLNGSPPRGQYAAFNLGVDPSVLEFQGADPLGDGALRVDPYPDHPGVLTIYRSSLSGGFSTVEDLAALNFTAMKSGQSLVVPSDVRLLDGQAQDIPVTFLAGEVYVE